MLKILPSSDSLNKLFETITCPDAAQYLCERFQQRAIQLNVQDKVASMQSELQRFSEYVRHNDVTQKDPWRGTLITPPAAEQYFRDRILQHAASVLSHQEILFEHAISDEANFLRAYSSKDTSFDEASNDAMDQFFNAWLKSHDMVLKDGIIYEMNASGAIKKDSVGNELTVDSQHLLDLLASNEFAKLVQEYDPSIHVTPIARDFPETTTAAERTEQVSHTEAEKPEQQRPS